MGERVLGGRKGGAHYIFEVVEQIGDGFALRVGEDVVVVDFRAAYN